jgi:hypothetical protein
MQATWHKARIEELYEEKSTMQEVLHKHSMDASSLNGQLEGKSAIVESQKQQTHHMQVEPKP